MAIELFPTVLIKCTKNSNRHTFRVLPKKEKTMIVGGLALFKHKAACFRRKAGKSNKYVHISEGPIHAIYKNSWIPVRILRNNLELLFPDGEFIKYYFYRVVTKWFDPSLDSKCVQDSQIHACQKRGLIIL